MFQKMPNMVYFENVDWGPREALQQAENEAKTRTLAQMEGAGRVRPQWQLVCLFQIFQSIDVL